MAAKTRTIQLQVIGSKAHVDLEVDSSATIAGIKQRLAREFGLDPKVKLLRKHQTSLSTLMDGEKPPKNGRIVVQGVSELRRVAPPAPPEVAGSSAEAFPKAPARAVAGAGAAPSQPPPWPRPPQQPPAAPAPKKEAKSQHSLWMMAMMTEEELSASQGEFESKATQGAEKKAREEEEARRLKEEAERRTREEEEKAKQAREEAERKAREEEKAARRLKEEAERKAREEEKAARKLKEEAERKAREEEEQARKLKEEAERKAREEEAARRFQEESERRAQEEQKRAQLAREEEAERRIREEAERKAREEEEVARRAKEEAERTTRLEEERAKAAREEVETRAREEEEARRAREEAERRANELADKATKAKEEAERRAREEEEARRAREEAEKRASEEEEEAQRAKEEAERRAREEEGARHAREDAERREADARRAMEEAERTAREGEEKARSAREEALRRAREEEEATRAREEMERRAGKEVGPRRTKEEANSTKDEAEMRAREEEEAARRWSAKEAERQIMEEMRLLQEAKKAQAEEAEQDVVTPEEGMVQVSIKHAIKRGEAKVTVPHDATFGDVKKALAKDLGRPELLEGRLVRPTGGGQYQAYYDMEAIRVKRRLLYMGPPIVLDNPQEAAASRSSAPRTGARKAAAKVEKIPLDEDGNPSLTLEQALNMQYDLYVGFADPDFQAELHALEQRNPKTSLKYMRDRQLHLFKVQEVVLPKYGFDSSLKGVYQMLQVMNNFDSSEQFNTRGAVLNDILGITPADATPVNKEEQKEPEQKEPEQKEPEQNQTEQPPDVLDDGQQHDESIPYLMDLKDGFTRLVRIILRTTSESVHVPVGENSTLRELFWLLSQPPWGGSLEELKRMPFLDATSSSEPELRLGDRVPSTIVLNAPMWPFSTADSTKPETFLPLWRMVELHQQVVARVRGEDFFRELEKVKDDNFEERKEGILLQVILDVIPAYGFSGDMIGLELFKAAAGLHSWHDALLQVQRELQEILTEVGAKLGFGASQDAQELPEGFWAPASEEAHAEKSAEAEAAGQEEEASGARAEGEADEVVVRLKHKVDGTELHVMVPSSATMRDVRAAAAEKLGNPSVLKDGRVVKKVGEFLQVYKDDELLGSKRRLLLLGTPLWAVSGDQAQEPLAEEPSPPVGPGKEEGPEEAETVEKAPKAKEGEEEMVEVTLKLSKGDDKVAVSVPKSATIKDVKEALAQKLNRPRLAAVANLVRKVGGGFASYRDLERLGGKRIMTVLGVDNLKAASRPPSAAPNLSVNQALSMQYELHDGFSDPEFQSKLKAIMAMHSPDSVAFRRERTKLILSVQSEVLPRYGFEGNLQGSLEMVQVMNRLSVENEEIGRLGAEINVFLGMSSGGEQQQPASAEQEAAPSSPVEDANVEIKHAVHGTKVSVALPSTATMRDVKEALAARLQKPEYAKRGRIVRSQGSTFTALPEDTVLGRRRQLLYMGPAIIVEPSAEEPTPEPSSRFQPAPTSTEAPEAPVANEHAEAAEAGSFGPMGVVPAQAEAKELGEGEIEVTVKPGVEDQGGSVRLIAKSSMTIIEVKQLLARTLGRPEAAKTARIVRKSKKGTNEGVLVSVRDTEVLGDKWRKRTLLVLNCELPKPEVKAEEASRDQIPIFGIPAELAQHENAFSIGITGREHKDITIQELKRKMLENQSLRRPLPADFMCVMDMRGDGYLAPLADSDKPYELASGQYVKLQFLGFSEEHLAAWLRSGAEARDEATKAWKSRPEPAPKPTPTPLPLARPRAHEDRMINVGLQYSMEQVYVTLQDDSTVLDLKVRLKEEYGVPSGVEVLARAKDGFFVTMEDFVRPKRTVVLKGVPTLNRTSKMLEDDMIKVMDEFNKRYAKAEFQKVVASWREGSTSVGSFREVTREIAFEVLPKFGIAASKEGLAEWAAAARAFMRFPTFAESWRKGQILLGTLGDKEAVRMYRSSVSREKGPAAQRESTSKHGALLVREISSYAALAREKKDADEAIDVMYKRIYEENREELWEGGNVKGHKMPSRFAVRRKYLEMPGTTVLHCTSTNEQTGSVVGGAVVFEVTADGIDLSRSPQIGEGENFIFDTQGNTVDESDDESQDPVDQNPSSHISVGYIDALASTPGSKAGSALLEHLNTMAASEGWDMLALHSVRVEHTLRFWEKQGFQYFGPGKDAAFRLSCLQNFGFAVPIASLERLLPPRPGCLFYAKFLTQV